MSRSSAAADETVESVEPPLPDQVRHRVVSLTADVLPALGTDEVPARLRPFVRFTPARRARLGATEIAALLSTDPVFRQRVAARVTEAAGALGEAVADGAVPAAADPVDVAALAYLNRPSGWEKLVGEAATAVTSEASQAELHERDRELQRLAEQLERAKSAARTDLERVRAELAVVRSEAEEMRAKVRELSKSLAAAERTARRAEDALSTERGRANAAASAHEAELRRVRARLADAELVAGSAKQAAKDTRNVDDARLWLLLETIGQAALGMRRELALNPPQQLPADVIAESVSRDDSSTGSRWIADDPTKLDQLLTLPKAHLVVDGYNVTKTGFGDLSLEQQRGRLVGRLGGLAAQTGAEITVVFDGAARLPVAPSTPRGVRVLFSPIGQTADEMIRRLVRAEPEGRPVIVVSTDNEVATGVHRSGAYPVTSAVLLRRLSRG